MTVPLTQSSILIIDDFAGMPTLLREFVKAMGVNTIDTASNGKACGLLRDVVKNNHESTEISSQIQAVFEGENLGAEGLALVRESQQEVKDLLDRISELNPANWKRPEYSAALARIEGGANDTSPVKIKRSRLLPTTIPDSVISWNTKS